MFPDDRSITAAILETSLDTVFTIGDEGLIVDVNAAATRMFGGSRQEFLGRNSSHLMATFKSIERRSPTCPRLAMY